MRDLTRTSPTDRSRRPRLRHRAGIAGLAVAGVAAALALAGCSAVTAPATAATSQATPGTGGQSAGGRGGGFGGGNGRGGVFGVIAAASGTVLQVQGNGIQTAVSYTARTTIRRTEDVAASKIAVGDCVVAVTAQNAAAATSVTVTDASSDGTCTGGFGGFGGSGQRQGGFTRPSGAPQAPSGATPRPRASGSPRVFGDIVIGKVTAAGATSLTVQSVMPTQGSTAQGNTTQGSTTGSTVKVALGSSTTITATVDATSSALKTGLCVRATGTANTSGGFAATALTLSNASSDGTCTQQGFGGRGFGGGAGGNGTNGTGSSSTGAAPAAGQSTGSTTNG